MRKKQALQTVNAGFEFSHDKAFLKVNAGLPVESRPVPITGALVIQPVEKTFVGAKFDFGYNPKDSSVTKNVEFKLATSAGSSARGFVTANLDKKVGLVGTYDVSSDRTVGARVNLDLPKSVTVEGKTNSTPLRFDVDFAAQQKVCKSSTVAAKLNVVPGQGDVTTGIRFGLGVVHTFPGATVTASGDLNVSGLLGNAGHADHSLGFELKLK